MIVLEMMQAMFVYMSCVTKYWSCTLSSLTINDNNCKLAMIFKFVKEIIGLLVANFLARSKI